MPELYRRPEVTQAELDAKQSATVEAVHLVGGAGEPAFTNSWVNFGSGYQVARFWKDRSIVYVEGTISRATGSAASPFTLPVGYRPTDVKQVIHNGLVGGAAAFFYTDIRADGTIVFGGTPTIVSLNFFIRVA